jgi:hypothetical protein
MPPQRTPLQAIDGNRRFRGPDLSPYERGRIIGARFAGLLPYKIELQYKHSRGAVQGTLALEILRLNGASMPRPGRPKIYNERDTRSIL